MFLQQCGVMQVESLSPSLFAININEIETIMNNIPSMGVFVGNRKIPLLRYVAEIVLCALNK